jgi:ABC-type transport system involved in multi-copper enzyme maturation permease subunit
MTIGRYLDAWKAFMIVTELVRDTFRQASASGISLMMSAVTAVCVVLCLSVGVTGDVVLQGGDEPTFFLPNASARAMAPGSGPSPGAQSLLETDPETARSEGVATVSGRMTLAFGAVSFPVSRERGDAVHFLELLLAGGIAGTFGLLIALIWTAGFIPSFLDPSAASVLLAKPVSRAHLLLGKYLGVLTFVGFHVVLFVALTWLALGVRTHVWDLAYFWCIPLLLIQFAIFYSASVLLAVVTRSPVACVFGSLLFWLTAWGINYGSVMARGVKDPRYLTSITRGLADLAYWISPKPIDAGLILFNALGAGHHFEKPVMFVLLESGPAFSPQLSILSSLLMTAALLATSVYEFKATDY